VNGWLLLGTIAEIDAAVFLVSWHYFIGHGLAARIRAKYRGLPVPPPTPHVHWYQRSGHGFTSTLTVALVTAWFLVACWIISRPIGAYVTAAAELASAAIMGWRYRRPSPHAKE
jgi:hypothetical protein